MTIDHFIDTDHYSQSGITFVKDGFFAGGEPHANVPHWPYGSVNVHAKIRTWDDFGRLLAVLSALRTQNVSAHLLMAYVPGLRQDRNPEGLTPLTPQIYGEALTKLVTTVTVADPHSTEGLNIFKRALNKSVRTLSPFLYLPDLLPLDTYEYVIQPDDGAFARTEETAGILGVSKHQILRCRKERDFETGKLSKFIVPATIASLPSGTRILLPDDICDAGGTFVGLAEHVHGINPDVILDLFVTHGIFSFGALGRLMNCYLGGNKGFEMIYTTDSFHIDGHHPYVRTIELAPYYIGGLHP